jgi:hypothetical protein
MTSWYGCSIHDRDVEKSLSQAEVELGMRADCY